MRARLIRVTDQAATWRAVAAHDPSVGERGPGSTMSPSEAFLPVTSIGAPVAGLGSRLDMPAIVRVTQLQLGLDTDLTSD